MSLDLVTPRQTLTCAPSASATARPEGNVPDYTLPQASAALRWGVRGQQLTHHALRSLAPESA
jgi:hypothetical protein